MADVVAAELRTHFRWFNHHFFIFGGFVRDFLTQRRNGAKPQRNPIAQSLELQRSRFNFSKSRGSIKLQRARWDVPCTHAVRRALFCGEVHRVFTRRACSQAEKMSQNSDRTSSHCDKRRWYSVHLFKINLQTGQCAHCSRGDRICESRNRPLLELRDRPRSSPFQFAHSFHDPQIIRPGLGREIAFHRASNGGANRSVGAGDQPAMGLRVAVRE